MVLIPNYHQFYPQIISTFSRIIGTRTLLTKEISMDLKRNLKMAVLSIIAIALMIAVFGIREKLLTNKQMNRLQNLWEVCQVIEAGSEHVTEHSSLFSKLSFNNRYNRQIVGESHHQFLDCVDSVQNNLNTYQEKVSDYENGISQTEREIRKLTKNLESGNEYERKTFYDCRRFDTDELYRGIYECVDTDLYKKVAVTAGDSEMSGYRVTIWVEYLGEIEVRVDYSNAFRDWSKWEYYRHYSSVSGSYTPSLWISQRDSLQIVHDNMNSKYSSLAKNSTKKLTWQTSRPVQQIIELLNPVLAE